MEVQNISIGAIETSPMNPRKQVAQAEIDELAQNIKAQGLLQPITVRPIEWDESLVMGEIVSTPTKYEIVCGERRYRACRSLWHDDPRMFAAVPCIVREMTPDQAFEAMVTENLQRKDIDPLEEAFAFSMLAARGDSAEDIAARIGKSVRFVQDRIKLNSLIEPLRERLSDGKLSLTVAILVSKLEQADQETFARNTAYHTAVSVDAAKGAVASILRQLSSMPWDEGFTCRECPVPCSQCRHNSSNLASLFYEFGDTGVSARCMCGEKFSAKRKAWGEKQLKEGDFAKCLADFGAKRVLIDCGAAYCTSNEAYGAMLAKAGELGLYVAKSIDCNKIWNAADAAALIASGEAFRGHPLSDQIDLAAPGAYRLANASKDYSASTYESNEARMLAHKYERIEAEQYFVVGKRMAEAYAKEPVGEEPLSDAETEALYTIMLVQSSNEFKRSIGVGGSGLEHLEYVKAHPEMRSAIRREWLRMKLAESCQYGERALVLAAARAIGEEKFTHDYEQLMLKAEAKAEKEMNAIADKLRKMGYSTDGEPLQYANDKRQAQ